MEFLYTLFIFPIELSMGWILELLYEYTNSYGFSVICLSLCVNFLTIPLRRIAEKMSAHEKFVQSVIQNEVSLINKVFKGQERYMMLQTLYRQYDYHPIYALRASLGLLLQIPFFIAAYKLLSTYTAFDQITFLFLTNLASADALVTIFNTHINALPIIMTVINLATIYIHTKHSTKSEKIQSIALAFLFLILLYQAPSGLVLYWTCNNVIYLVRSFFETQHANADIPQYNSKTIRQFYSKKSQNWDMIFNRITIIAPLAYLLSNIFMWSNNAHMFSFSAIGFSTLVIILVSFILWAMGELWGKLHLSLLKTLPKLYTVLSVFLFSGIISLLLGLLLEPIINPIPIKPILLFIWTITLLISCLAVYKKVFTNYLALHNLINLFVFSGVFSLILWVFCLNEIITSYKIPLSAFGIWGFTSLLFAIFCNKYRYLNVLLVFFLVISSLRLGAALITLSYEDYLLNLQTSQEESIAKEVKLNKKPNIYLFWLESYHDFEVLSSVYGIDTEPMKSFLHKSQFKVYENTYSDGQSTLVSYVNLFSMGEFRAKTHGHLDVGFEYRKLLAGNEKNNLLKILKNNGYLTQIIYSNPFEYSGLLKFQNLDVANYNTSWWSVNSRPLFTFSMKSQYYFLQLLGSIIKIEAKRTLIQEFDVFFENGLQSGKPFFLCFEGGATHTPNHEYSYKDRDKWVAPNGIYHNWVKRADAEIENIVSKIIKKDPNSIIVMIGDHGAWRFSGLLKGQTVTEMRQSAEEENINYEDVMDDAFRVHLSIRLPNGDDFDLRQGYYMSHVNLFNNIFSYLSDNPKILANRSISQSIFHGVPVIEEGKILQE